MLIFKTIMAPLSMAYDKKGCDDTTLYDLMSKWFIDLKPRYITFFVELVRLFVTDYTRKNLLKKESHHLFFVV